jgi:hypothetical protein
MPRVKTRAAVQRFHKRVAKLQTLGFKLTQIAPVVGLSYTGLYRMTVSKNLEPATRKVAEYHKRLDVWCKSVASV